MIKPIAPTWRKEPVDDPDWLFDLKYDGSRGLTYIASTRASAIARFLVTAKQEPAVGDMLATIIRIYDFRNTRVGSSGKGHH